MPRTVTIFKIHYQVDPDPGAVLDYAANFAQAILEYQRQQKLHTNNGAMVSAPTIRPYQVEFSKRGIVQFLKHHTPSTDNG